jgi:hypothetical protein
MAAPVTTKGVLACAHQGALSLGAASKLTVEGDPVQTFSASYTGSYAGCTSNSGQCTTTTPFPAAANPGSAVKLTISSAPALLSTLTANTTPAGTPLKSVDPGQTKLTAS